MSDVESLGSTSLSSAALASSIARILNDESTSREEVTKLAVSEEQFEQLLNCFSKCAQQVNDSGIQEDESKNCVPINDAYPNVEPYIFTQDARLEIVRSELDECLLRTSHDMQSPARKLAMFSEILEEELGTIDISEDAARSLKAIRNATRQMRDYLRSSIRLLRVIRHEPTLEKVSVDLIIDKAIESLATELEATEAVVRREVMPQVVTDTGLLTSVYTELLTNALKFRHKSEAPEITLSYIQESENSSIIFVIEDQGIGVPEEKLRDVVKARMKLHPTTTFTGDGVGLAFCERAIEKMGGKLWLEKSQARGVRVCFTLKSNQEGLQNDE